MKKFDILKSIPANLPMINVDTDMIIPKQFLKTIKKNYLPPEKFVKLLKKRFSPYCSVATWYLWRSIDPEPIQY